MASLFSKLSQSGHTFTVTTLTRFSGCWYHEAWYCTGISWWTQSHLKMRNFYGWRLKHFAISWESVLSFCNHNLWLLHSIWSWLARLIFTRIEAGFYGICSIQKASLSFWGIIRAHTIVLDTLRRHRCSYFQKIEYSYGIVPPLISTQFPWYNKSFGWMNIYQIKNARWGK